jgi:hypothetical protein
MRRRRVLELALFVGILALAVGLAFGLQPGGFLAAGGRWVPSGVEEIDVRAPNPPLSPRKAAPPILVRVTDPSQVERIVSWFDGLTKNSHLPANAGCAGGEAANVSFTFRGASGNVLATANSSPGTAWSCDPIHLAVGGRPEAFLYDARRADSLIGRVQQLLRVKFRVMVYLG